MNVESFERRIPRVRTSLSDRGEAALLSAMLVGGLMFAIPLIYLTLGVSVLLLVGLVGAGFGLFCVLLRRVELGLYVTLVVTMTFVANVPVVTRKYRREVPGTLEPDIWLVYLPLVAVVGVLLWKDRVRRPDPSTVECLFGGFVAWTAVSAFLADPIRRDVAILFAMNMLVALVIFSVVSRGVRNGHVEFQSVVIAFLITVLGQAGYGLAQFLNQAPFGITLLGEAAVSPKPFRVAQMSFGPLGTAKVGLFISGFTGMAFVLASLLVLGLPIGLAYAIRTRGRWRLLAAGGFALGAVVLRATISDAARGGFLVCILVFLSLLQIRSDVDVLAVARRLPGRVRRWKPPERLRGLANSTVPGLLCGLAVLFAGLYPSSQSGVSAEITNVDGTPPSDEPANGGDTTPVDGGNGTTPVDGGNGTTPVDGGNGTPPSDPGGQPVEELSVPFFDLSNLGPRLQQYAVGIDLFKQNPILGIGGGNFKFRMAEYGAGEQQALHNMYLMLLVETGIPGFVLYTGAVILVLWAGWKLSERTDDATVVVLAVLAGMVGYLGFAFWDHLALDRFTSFFPFWVLAGAIVGEHDRRTG